MSARRAPRPKLWMNSTEAAQYLGVHISTLSDWREKRIGPPYHRHDNGAIRYRVTELDAYLERTRHAVG